MIVRYNAIASMQTISVPSGDEDMTKEGSDFPEKIHSSEDSDSD